MTLLIDCKPTTTTSSPGPTRKIKQHMKLQNVSGEVIVSKLANTKNDKNSRIK